MATGKTSLADALSTCLSLIEGGVLPSDCLAAYPQFADELAPMLHTVSLLKSQPKSLPAPHQIERMQAVYLKKVRAPRSIFANPMAWAAIAAAVAAVVIGLGTFFALDQMQESARMTVSDLPTEVSIAVFAEAETETATETKTETSTPTATDSETATATETSTPTAADTETATETKTETSTATATDSETATETSTATATDTETATATQTATQTATNTATRTATATATSTATDIPEAAQAPSVPQPDSSTFGGGFIRGTASATSTPGDPEEPLGPGETDCILADNCLLLDGVANLGLVMAGNTTTLIFSVDQTQIPVEIAYDLPREANCVAGYCTRFDGEAAVAWFTQGDVADIWHIQFWDFSADTDQDGVPDVDDACPTGTLDTCDDEDNELVTICHIPPGNPDSAHTIIVAEPAVEDHLAHGDTLGECPQTPEPPEQEQDNG